MKVLVLFIVSFKGSYLFYQALDAKMKDAPRHSLHLKYKKEEKEAIIKEEEELFWSLRLLETSTAKSLLINIHLMYGPEGNS